MSWLPHQSTSLHKLLVGFLFVFMLLGASKLAADEISTAFGIELGVELAPEVQITGRYGPLAGRGPRFADEVMPPIPNINFSQYLVWRTPSSRLVYRISGRADLSEIDCYKRQREIEAALRQLYPTARWSYDKRIRTISTYPTGIRTNCAVAPLGTLFFVTYVNYELQRLAEDEQSTLDAEAADKNGL